MGSHDLSSAAGALRDAARDLIALIDNDHNRGLSGFYLQRERFAALRAALARDAGAVAKCPTFVGYKLPLRYDSRGAIIFDADGTQALDVRGWGHLTGGAALNLGQKRGERAQDVFGQFVVDAVNSKIPSPSPTDGAKG